MDSEGQDARRGDTGWPIYTVRGTRAMMAHRSVQVLALDAVCAETPDVLLTALEYSWGTDRVDQTALPLDGGYTPRSDGAGAAVFVLDTGCAVFDGLSRCSVGSSVFFVPHSLVVILFRARALLRLDTLHAEFADALESEATREVANLWNGYGGVTANTDGDGHGTHCAGTVGGLTVGVAPGASIYGIKASPNTLPARPFPQPAVLAVASCKRCAIARSRLPGPRCSTTTARATRP